MKLTMITVTGLVLLSILVSGCQEENVNKAPDERVMNTKLMEIYSNSSIQNAIISEHTLYPYHFVKDGADLNELGRRDLAVLARHFAKNGGPLNIRRLNAPDELYEARVGVVYAALQDAGIDMARIDTSDGMPIPSVQQEGESGGPNGTQVSEVRNALSGTGITVADGMPGGEGMPSERVLIILERKTENTTTQTSTSYSGEMR
jgi:hypothetical protein